MKKILLLVLLLSVQSVNSKTIHNSNKNKIYGVYELNEFGTQGKLNLIQTKEHEILFNISIITPSGNMGELTEKSQYYDGISKFSSKEKSCDLIFHIREKEVIVSQVGYCEFGMNVLGDGTYKLNPKLKPDLSLEY